MNPSSPPQTRHALLAFFFAAMFVALMAGCGTSTTIEGAVGAVAVSGDPETSTPEADQAEAPQDAPADEEPAADDVDRAPLADTETEDADIEDAEIEEVRIAEEEIEEEEPDAGEPEAAAPTNDASAPESDDTASDDTATEDAEPAAPAGEQADSGDTNVAAIARDVTTYTCPANSTGNPSEARPVCSREQTETVAPGLRTEPCTPGHALVDDVCERVIRDDARFTYTCPRPETNSQSRFTSVSSLGSGPEMSCRYETHEYRPETRQYICDLGDSLDQQDGIDVCTTGSAVEVEPIVVDSGLTCEPLGSILAEDPGTGRMSCELGVEVLVPATDKKCPEGTPVEADGTVVSCRVLVPKYLDVTQIVLFGCPNNATETGRDTTGRPQCLSQPATYPPAQNWICPPGTQEEGQSCRGQLLQDRQTGPTATPCPEGEAALTEDRDVCSAIPTLPADPRTFNTCPDDAALNRAGECTIIRTIDVAAIERTNVEYSCPTGSTGQPTAANPFCRSTT